eukprot:751846-Hanusia_phi.AAC.1
MTLYSIAAKRHTHKHYDDAGPGRRHFCAHQHDTIVEKKRANRVEQSASLHWKLDDGLSRRRARSQRCRL